MYVCESACGRMCFRGFMFSLCFLLFEWMNVYLIIYLTFDPVTIIRRAVFLNIFLRNFSSSKFYLHVSFIILSLLCFVSGFIFFFFHSAHTSIRCFIHCFFSFYFDFIVSSLIYSLPHAHAIGGLLQKVQSFATVELWYMLSIDKSWTKSKKESNNIYKFSSSSSYRYGNDMGAGACIIF